MIAVRYILPGILIVLGLVALPLNPNGLGVDLFSMFVGAGLAVALLNALFRLGASGDADRQAEVDARAFLAEHGHWPDELPS